MLFEFEDKMLLGPPPGTAGQANIGSTRLAALTEADTGASMADFSYRTADPEAPTSPELTWYQWAPAGSPH